MKMYPPFPHMVLNSHNVPPPDYQMFNSWKVSSSDPPAFMVSQICDIGAGLLEKKWQTVIFNSHGSPGKIHIGTGISLGDAPLFIKLKGKVVQIWIVACQVAGGSTTSTTVTGTSSGIRFCQALSDKSGAVIYASSRNQSVEEPTLGYGEIDFYEGQTFMFTPGSKSPYQVQGG
jgi:hypothetical protein